MPRICVFCGEPAKTVEDVWPCWMTNHFIAPGVMEIERGPAFELKTHPVDRPELAIKCVCAKCNNGWMSQLQDAGKPIIERLWNEEACDLELGDCRTLSLWAVMTSMVLQAFGDEETQLYSDLERTLMWKNHIIHPYMFILIANSEEFTSMISECRSIWSGASRTETRQTRANAINIAFGRLCIQVLKIVPPGDIVSGSKISLGQDKSEWAHAASKIWPLKGQPVHWPPANGIHSEDQMNLFIERFRHQGGVPDVTIDPP
jgi:hypothetical protein